MCTWCLEAHRFCCQKEFLRDLGSHIDLGRGHLPFDRLGVRAEVTSEQSPHLLLPLMSFGPQGHKIPAEIQPHISSDECAICGAACDSSSLKNKNICGSPPHRTTEHQKLTTPTQNPCMERMDQRKIPCDEERDYWENRKGRWVGVHGIARRYRQTDTIRPNA